LTVVTNGPGTVAPNLTGKALVANRKYSLTATAKKNNMFSIWTGSIITNKNPLTFTMEDNMVLQANFVTNPFLAVQGAYNGLFTASNGAVTEETAGMLKDLTINSQGTYSGTILINGATHPISGIFSLGGQSTNVITRPHSQGGPLLVEMTFLAPSNAAPVVTGIIYGTNVEGVAWVSTNLLADIATNVQPSGEYTVLFASDSTNVPPTNAPPGDGYASITNSQGTAKVPGNAKIIGSLPDGTAFSQTVPVSQNGFVPVYVNLYSS
jgi:hypothetical protein